MKKAMAILIGVLFCSWNLSAQTGHGILPVHNQSYVTITNAPWQDRIYSSANDFNYTTNNSTITITGYKGAGGAISLPPMIEGMPVVGVGYIAFFGNTNITSVIIPDSIVNIAESAFDTMAELTNVIIGSGVTNLGDGAFACGVKLATVYFKGNAPSIGFSPFDFTNIVYYLSGNTGFSTNFAGWPTAIWGPVVAAGIIQNDVTNTPDTHGNITLPSDTSKVSTNGSGAGLTGITAAQTGAASTQIVEGISNRVVNLEGSTNAQNTAIGNLNAGSNLYVAADTAVSNAFRTADTVVSNIAAAALPASFTNAASVTALQITGGSPTNGAVFTATNSAGQGAWSRRLPKMVTFNTQTTNTQNLTISGAGFRPIGALINTKIETLTPFQGSFGQIDGYGAQDMICTYLGTAFAGNTANCAALYIGGGSWKLTWTAWTDDGATFTQASGSMTTNTITAYILFFP